MSTDIPVTPEEDEYFQEMERLRGERIGLAGTPPAVGEHRFGHNGGESGSGGSDAKGSPAGGVVFRPAFFDQADAFSTLRNYLNAAPDGSLLRIEGNELWVTHGGPA